MDEENIIPEEKNENDMIQQEPLPEEADAVTENAPAAPVEVSESDPVPAIAVSPEPAEVKPHIVPGIYDSAVTVYVPYQPEGPTVTQLEKAAKEAKTVLKKQRKSDRRRLRNWKRDARRKAQSFISEMKDCETPEDKAILKKRYKAEKRAWHKSIKDLDESEKILQKKAFKAFRKRLTRGRRAIAWALLFAAVCGLVWVAVPVWENLGTVIPMKYSTDSETAQLARIGGAEISEAISDEGIVLLENRENFLPLQNKKVNVFGVDSYRIDTGKNAKSGISLFEGLERAGIAYNVDLHSVYLREDSEKTSPEVIQTAKKLVRQPEQKKGSGTEYLTDEIMEAARKYSDQALVVIGSDAESGKDLEAGSLTLSAGRTALLRKLDENFEHIVVVLNTAGMAELNAVDECRHVDAVIWMGVPGPYGCVSLGKILSGEINPSGRLPDTWAYEAASIPAAVNFTKDPNRYKYSETDKNYEQFEEGIYVGYRYYETRYLQDEAGYRKAVRYPFGYGIDYTDFSWETVSFRISGDSAVWRVRVTNTGDTAGKDVLQLYYSAPYTENGTEKSEAVLADYVKTDLIEPGSEQMITLRVRARDMASYSTDEEAYVLDEGAYRLSLCRNVHEPVETEEYLSEETVVFRSDEVTASEIKNRFSFADGDLTYLSRGDWIGTYPKGLANEPGSSELRANIRKYNTPEASHDPLPETDANNGIKLYDLKGLDYDDEKWSQFLDQFSLDELFGLFARAGWVSEPINRLGIPTVKMLGGTSGFVSRYTDLKAQAYPSEIVLASTWNDELAEKFGAACGAEAAAYGIQVWYAPELSIHRTPYGGNNAESWSEDPLLSGRMAANTVLGAQSKGVVAVLKGYITDSNVSGEEAGVYTWISEQALREIYLRPFEIAVKQGGAHGVMSSITHLGYKWCGACEELLKEILREEWGFEGFVTSDVVRSSYMDSALACRRGNDLMLETGLLASERNVRRAYKADPSGVAEGLRECAHNFCYTIVNYTYLF